MTVKEKILYNVESIIEEHASMKDEAEKKKNAEAAEELRVDTAMDTMMTSAMGKIDTTMQIEAIKEATKEASKQVVDNTIVLDESTVTPFTKAHRNKKQKASNWTPYDIAINSVERATQSDISSSEDRIKVHEQRDKQKHEEAMKRLELETRRHEAEVHHKELLFQFQKEQAERDTEYRMEQLKVQQKAFEMQTEQSQLMRLLLQKMNDNSK